MEGLQSKDEALHMQIYPSSPWDLQQCMIPKYCESHLGVNYLISMIYHPSQISYLCCMDDILDF